MKVLRFSLGRARVGVPRLSFAARNLECPKRCVGWERENYEYWIPLLETGILEWGMPHPFFAYTLRCISFKCLHQTHTAKLVVFLVKTILSVSDPKGILTLYRSTCLFFSFHGTLSFWAHWAFFLSLKSSNQHQADLKPVPHPSHNLAGKEIMMCQFFLNTAAICNWRSMACKMQILSDYGGYFIQKFYFRYCT